MTTEFSGISTEEKRTFEKMDNCSGKPNPNGKIRKLQGGIRGKLPVKQPRCVHFNAVARTPFSIEMASVIQWPAI
jgi:hypothetical protein